MIGPDTTNIWTYTGYTGPFGLGTPAISNNGINSGVSITQGYYTFTTPPIDNDYVQSILNQSNAYGIICAAVPSANYSGSSVISCTSQPVLVSGSNSVNYF